MSEIGDFLLKTRQEQQISIRYLAKLTGISHSEINKIENGERENPSPLKLKAIAKVLGINQIECFKTAGYIDDTVATETAPSYLSNCTSDEMDKIKSYIQFLRSQHKDEEKEEAHTMKNGLKVASLFAGIGGICYGFQQAGAQIVWANEIDKDACKTYRHNFGNEYLVEGDIKMVNPDDIPQIDILNGGFPCQAFSVAGYRKGFEDERGNLFLRLNEFLKQNVQKQFCSKM